MRMKVLESYQLPNSLDYLLSDKDIKGLFGACDRVVLFRKKRFEFDFTYNAPRPKISGQVVLKVSFSKTSGDLYISLFGFDRKGLTRLKKAVFPMPCR